MKSHESKRSNSKTQCKRTKDHVIDKLQGAYSNQRANHNQVQTPSLKQTKSCKQYKKMPTQFQEIDALRLLTVHSYFASTITFDRPDHFAGISVGCFNVNSFSPPREAAA